MGLLRLPGVLSYGFRLATSPRRALPDFVIIGAGKAGTTYLYEHLCRNPLVWSAAMKEVHFFDRHYPLGLLWYRAQFPLRTTMALWSRLKSGRSITGEASPNYLYHPAAPKRIFQTLPEVKAIAVLRNPVDRAVSHYHMIRQQGHEDLAIEEALDAEEERIAGEAERLLDDPHYWSKRHFFFSYKARGVYVGQLLRWEQHFPREQMLVLKSETLFAEPGRVFPEVCRFLGLPEWAPRLPKKINVGRYPPAPQEVRERLQSYFEPHNQRLYEHLGEDWGWAV